MLMEKMTTYEMKRVVEEGKCVIVGFSSFDQHGPVLPIDEDNLLCRNIINAVAEETNQIAAPVMHIGYSTPWTKYAGTITFRSETYLHVVLDILDSLIATGFKKIFIVNCHCYGTNRGTNPDIIKSAIRIIMDRFSDKKVEFLFYGRSKESRESVNKVRKSEMGGMWHAGEYGTALYMYLDPENVRKDRVGEKILTGLDVMGEYPEYRYFSEWFDPEKYVGYFGDPSQATPENGEKFFNIIVKDISDTVRKFVNNEIEVRWERNKEEVSC